MFGRHVRLAVALLYAASVLMAEVALAAVGGVGSLWAQGGILGFAFHLGWQVAGIEHANTTTALRLFRSNRDAGLILAAGLAVAVALGTT